MKVNQWKNWHKQSMKIVMIAIVCLMMMTACAEGGNDQKEIRIGYQKGATMLTLKNDSSFTKELEEKGYEVSWSEFNTGSSILEALHSDSIDFANAGDLPVLFALAKGSEFQLIASEPNTPETEGILVSPDSGIERLEDLKHKKVAYNKASISQYLTEKALDSVDLTIDDITSVHLDPSDASIAFEKGEVDAWVVWDPYMTVAENGGNHILQTGKGLVVNQSFYLSTKNMTEKYPDVVETYLTFIEEIDEQIEDNPSDAAKIMEEVTKEPSETWEQVLQRGTLEMKYIDDEVIMDMNTQAEDIFEMGLVDNQIQVDDKVWKPNKSD